MCVINSMCVINPVANFDKQRDHCCFNEILCSCVWTPCSLGEITAKGEGWSQECKVRLVLIKLSQIQIFHEFVPHDFRSRNVESKKLTLWVVIESFVCNLLFIQYRKHSCGMRTFLVGTGWAYGWDCSLSMRLSPLVVYKKIIIILFWAMNLTFH